MNKKINNDRPQDFKKEELLKFLSLDGNYDSKKYNEIKNFITSDGRDYTEEEISERVEKVVITAAVEIERRKGYIEVSDNYDWLNDYEIEVKVIECPYCQTLFENSGNISKCPICSLDLRKYYIYLMR